MPGEQKVTGIGGVFFKAKDPEALAAWYKEHLGVPLDDGATYGAFSVGDDGRDATGTPLMTVWSTFPVATEYFGSGSQTGMINYRVADLDAMLKQLREAGVTVDEKTDDSEYGKFGWAVDPEGNRFELWQPPSTMAGGN